MGAKRAGRKQNEGFTEQEAAAALGISLRRLHELLDTYIFNQGSPRPATLEFTSSDLLLLAFWDKQPAAREVGSIIEMPKRN